jgi:putative Mg2+ transporter-C (MgtC) family protein
MLPTFLPAQDILLRLLLAAALGALLGAERELRRKSAGFRTNILIALGSALFTILSVGMGDDAPADHTRIAAQSVTGIGFLGAGAILRTDRRVHGLTTAATIWVNAALGMAAGAGRYQLAILGGFVTLAVLFVLAPIEHILERNAREREAERRATDRRT